MRLLEQKCNGNFSLTKDLIVDIPPYAILSHTWGLDTEEVTFKDLIDDTGKSKAGYEKIKFCGEQAKRDGLRYFWVDTCCIDKSSSAELTEAINSMFSWYRKSAKCYVYLPDVYSRKCLPSRKVIRLAWEEAFKNSQWFTRGWTLQELIAPKVVEFFSTDGMRLGDKRSMVKQIHEITGVAIQALRETPLSTFSLNERMSWAKGRNTTREEDKAYSLLGIFDIHMPLIYGEGKEKAFVRLREQIEKEKPQVPRLTKIRKWLSPPDPSLDYYKALKQRRDDTGLWFLESEKYSKWKIDSTSLLWLYGIPGCGKTILSSTILQNVFEYCADDLTKVVAYFYLDFNDAQKQVPELMIRSLISQLLQQCVKMPPTLELLFSSCENGHRQPTLDGLLEVLHQMILEFPQSYIVLDALDESNDRAELIEILERIVHWQLDGLHLLVTSRRERDIERSLENLVQARNMICLQSEDVDMDISNYVHHRLSIDKDLNKWQKDPTVIDEIETVIMKGAHGMFRWAVCQLDALTKCLSRKMLREALADLPMTLDLTYERILTSIQIEYSEYALRILRWLTFSARPLLVEEVAEVLAIDVNHDPVFDREEVLEDPQDVLKICSSLITIATTATKDKVVLLAHYSVKEYLISDRSREGPAARYSMQATTCNEFIAKSCLGYLLQFRQPDSISIKSLQESRLARYSAEFWITHAQTAAQKALGLNCLVMQFFASGTGAYLNWARIYHPEAYRKEPDFKRTLASVPTPLYFASRSGLTVIVELLLGKGADVNAQGGHYGNALQAASWGGHTAIVELLLGKGADVNAQSYGNALQAASSGGHTAIVELLLGKGADVNAQGGHYGNALQAASSGGHTAIVELLLGKGADVNAQGGYYGNALQAASWGGHTAIVELLLGKGADVNAQGGHYGNTLQAASWGGHTAIVELLLGKGADVNAQGGHYGNALQTASWGGHTAIVELLLGKGADVNARGDYSNALQAASSGGHTAIVELLLGKGADVNAQGGHYGNALQAASWGGHTAIVELLLGKGADVNAQGGHYGNALQAASWGGHTAIVELLLGKGADVNAQGGVYGNALQTASWGGHTAIVELLLGKGADVNAQGGHYGNALQAASSGGHTAIVELLLGKGADVNAQGGHYGNALQAASWGGHTAIVELLLGKGADVNAQGGHYGNALQAASSSGGHTAIVELLLGKGADVNAQGGHYGNALQTASWGGHTAIVELLLGKGADVNARGDYSNALQAASWGGHTAIVELLLGKGADVNAQGGYYGNALQAASSGGHTAIVELLLGKGADVNAQGGHYGNALQAASSGGHTAIVELLLGKGADVNAQGGHYGNALQAASSSGGHTAIVELLLGKGADVNAQGGHYGNALQTASWGGHTAIVELLLGKGADVNARGDYSNALQAASWGGHTAIVELLLGKGADVNARGDYSNALQAASWGGHTAIVELLLGKGADVNARGDYSNALQAASWGGHTAIVEPLLGTGAIRKSL